MFSGPGEKRTHFCTKHPCPKGYKYYQGHSRQNDWSRKLIGEELSIEHCKRRCEAFLQCCSFEWTEFYPDKGVCKLNKECKPNLLYSTTIRNVIFCAKEQQDIGQLVGIGFKKQKSKKRV